MTTSYNDSKPQFTLYTSAGPNPWKVAYILHELKLSFKTSYVEYSHHKDASYTALNPNGRTPTLVDHSAGDFTIWESGAIILYLVQRYDTAHVLNPETFEEQALAQQWLMFQMSGQGPMWGQFTWFTRSHPEKVPSAEDRYYNEIVRTIGVLDKALEGKEWLVGGKMSYADLSFVAWCWLLEWLPRTKDIVGKGEKGEETIVHKNFVAWLGRMMERESVKKTLKLREEEMEANK
ncbi:glutathione S-transferase [Geopyxis carbonaria]|nr:glutathione S-transferase [Geopyxis carbonaria]